MLSLESPLVALGGVSMKLSDAMGRAQSGVTSMPHGPAKPGTVATTVLVAVLMMETVLDP
jgi:hypothetical protein